MRLLTADCLDHPIHLDDVAVHPQDVPVNELHSKGYVSIGCQPCTRPVLPNQHEREGRWWWEDAGGKECGLHSGNVSAGSAEQVLSGPSQELNSIDMTFS